MLAALGAALGSGLLGGPIDASPTAGAGGAVPVAGQSAPPVLPAVLDLSAVALAIIVAAACIGLARGARRELATLAITLLLSLAVGRLWSLLAWALTALWNGIAAIVPGGYLPRLMMPSEDASSWQIGIFLVGVVVLAYGGSRLIASGVVSGGGHGVLAALERVIGAGLGAMTGHVVARFVLSRIVPAAVVSPFSAGSRLAERLQALGPRAALAIMLLVIVLGALSIGSLDRGPRQKVYN